MFTHSHDEDNMGKKDLAYAFALTHVGIPVVYFTGNNYDPADQGSRNWLKIGYESALGDWGNGRVPNLVYVHNQFARGSEWKRWDDGDVYVFERFEDTGNSTPDSGEGLLLVGLNDSGWDQPRTVQVAFQDGTILHDYTGNNPSDVTVSGGQATITIPGMSGQGFVCYAPYNGSADGDGLRFSTSGTPAGTMDWVIPGGRRVGDTPRTVTRLTNDTVDIDVHVAPPPGGAIGDVKVKWGGGLDIGGGVYNNDASPVVGGYLNATFVSGNQWRLTGDLTGVPEGLHLVKARCFNDRPGLPALFNTFHESVYVDRHGPDIDTVNLAEAETIQGDRVITISNPDKTAGWIEVRIDGGSWVTAHEVMRGTWKYTIQGLAAGPHTIDILAHEYDYADPRVEINSTTLTRNFTVALTGQTLTMNHAEGTTLNLPFFTTAGTKGAGTITLLWDGYVVDGVNQDAGTYDNVFTGSYISGGQPLRFTGAFVNGPHFFEAILDDGGGNVRVVARTVFFDLYGKKDDPTDSRFAYDSDGDGLPDDIEAPGFTDGSFPGPNVQWPGDSNWDMIPNNGEVWNKLNPMNHDTTYNGTWDGDEDWDGDSYPNLCEVIQGFIEHGNPAYYNIYDAGSHPATCESGAVASQVSWSPNNPDNCDGSSVTISYAANEGPLEGLSPVSVGINTNGGFHGVFEMTPNGGTWQYVHNLDTNTTDLAVWFQAESGGTVYDNNEGANYTKSVSTCIDGEACFTMDGEFDSAHYEVANTGMKIVTAVSGNCLYFATWSSHNDDASAGDNFIFVTDQLADAEAAPWGKSGIVNFNKATKPWAAGESDNYPGAFHSLNNGGNLGRVAMGPEGSALEAEVNLLEAFGYVPDVVYIAAVAYGDNNGDQIVGQCPAEWEGLEWDEFLQASVRNLNTMEFQPVCIESIRDEDLDGYFDGGTPYMESIVAGSATNANYDLRRFIINELMDEEESITINLYPNVDPADTVTDVELVSNLNRRDFAVMDEDLDTVTTASQTTYYRAYPMSSIGGGGYTATLPIRRCGAYRVNARYRVNGGPWVYYTDHCQRRDLAVVVSPNKVLDTVIYEVNPSIVEATGDSFSERSTFEDLHMANLDRPDYLNIDHFKGLGVNMLWLQPIHPIGIDGREIDPDEGGPWDPGSPYAVRDYWKVNPILGDDNTDADALAEFQALVADLDANGIGVMMDGTFNHSSPDCVLGQGAVDLFGWATNGNMEIRQARPQWFAKAGSPGQHATYYTTPSDNDIAIAPDRIDFSKWNDVRELWFGSYDYLVKGGAQGQTSSRHFKEFLSERDAFDGHDVYSREVWDYFAYYPLFWLDKTGCPEGTPREQSHRGIDGLRCDFAQGLPNEFWEYCINTTRQRKWDFLFMAESLDGNRVIDGDPRHGVGYRSSRHFDILNENMVFYWRDQFFNYQTFSGGGEGPGAVPETLPTKQAFDSRKEAFDISPILLNLTSHDEVFPSDDPYRLAYAYGIQSAMVGAPMLMYGQEAGAQNDFGTYPSVGSADHNWTRYETNFGKSIPNFKRFNNMTSVWANRDWGLQGLYGRIAKARLNYSSLRSRHDYFLSRLAPASGYDPDIFAVAKMEKVGVSAATQSVVIVFVNNDYASNPNRSATFDLSAEVSPGVNWFGIDPTHTYTVNDLIATNPTYSIWGLGRIGQDIIDNGIFVGLPYQGQHGHFLKLVDLTDPGPGDNDGDGLNDWQDLDDDNDGLSDLYEQANGLDHLDGTGDNGADGDADGDHVSNRDERDSGTSPTNSAEFLEVNIQMTGSNVEVMWDSSAEVNYAVQSLPEFGPASAWQTEYFGTGLGSTESILDIGSGITTQKHYRIEARP
jgi:glycosidase